MKTRFLNLLIVATVAASCGAYGPALTAWGIIVFGPALAWALSVSMLPWACAAGLLSALGALL